MVNSIANHPNITSRGYKLSNLEEICWVYHMIFLHNALWGPGHSAGTQKAGCNEAQWEEVAIPPIASVTLKLTQTDKLLHQLVPIGNSETL